MTIRPPTPIDLPALAAIYQPYLGQASMQLRSAEAADFLVFLPGAATGHALLLGVIDQQIVGYALVKPYSPRAGYRLAGETSVYLRPDATGRGYGRLLMEGILAEAHALGYRHLTAKIWTSNQGSIDFHQRLGYSIVGVQHGIGWVNERAIDVTIMEAQLSNP